MVSVSDSYFMVSWSQRLRYPLTDVTETREQRRMTVIFDISHSLSIRHLVSTDSSFFYSIAFFIPKGKRFSCVVPSTDKWFAIKGITGWKIEGKTMQEMMLHSRGRRVKRSSFVDFFVDRFNEFPHENHESVSPPEHHSKYDTELLKKSFSDRRPLFPLLVQRMLKCLSCLSVTFFHSLMTCLDSNLDITNPSPSLLHNSSLLPFLSCFTSVLQSMFHVFLYVIFFSPEDEFYIRVMR